MTVTINYKNKSTKINSSNLIMFSDEKFNISPLKNIFQVQSIILLKI